MARTTLQECGQISVRENDTIAAGGPVLAIAISADGKRIVTGHSVKKSIVWDSRSRRTILKREGDAIVWDFVTRRASS